MRQFRIKTKKDWCIAFLFTTFIVYAITTRFSFKLQRGLLYIGNFRLTEMSQPKSYGNVIVTILIMTLITFIVICFQKKSVKIKLMTLIVGIALAGATLGAYLLHCNLIVSVTQTLEPVNVHVSGWTMGFNVKMNEEQEKQLVAYCEELEPVSKEEQRQLQNIFYAPDTNYTGDSLLIWIVYPKKYGHDYDLMVCVYDEMIFIRKGYGYNQKQIVTFCKDYGLLALIDQIVEK